MMALLMKVFQKDVIAVMYFLTIKIILTITKELVTDVLKSY